jgi:hypothetical protein
MFHLFLSYLITVVGDWVSPFEGGIVYQGGSRSGSSSLEGGASGSGEDDEEDDASEQEEWKTGLLIPMRHQSC